MAPLVKAGYVYIAQPPLYKITRKKKEQYIQNNAELDEILIKLGIEDAILKSIETDKVISGEPLGEILRHLSKLDQYSWVIKGNSGDFEKYLSLAKDGKLPKYLIQVRTGNLVDVEFCFDDDDLRKFSDENPDLYLFGRKVLAEGEEPEKVEKPKVFRRARKVEIHESKQIASLLSRLRELGLDVDRYSSDKEPLFEVQEGDGENANTTPMYSLPEILEAIKELGKRGMQLQRFKGLGEMNAKELFTTTMDPKNRQLLRVKMDEDNQVEADKMFTVLMGDVVEPRRQFIEDNALNVRNLDV